MPTARERDLSRELDRSDPIIGPSVPIVPAAPPSILQEQQVGGQAWQMNKLVKEETKLERTAREMGAKARTFAQSRVDEGSSQFADLRSNKDEVRTMTDPATGETREYRLVVTDGNPDAFTDQQILAERAARLGGVLDGTRRDPERGPHITEISTSDRAAAEKRRASMPRYVEVPMRDAYDMPPNEMVTEARARLADAGADLTIGGWDVIDNPDGIGMLARWRADNGKKADESAPQGRADAQGRREETRREDHQE